MLLPLILVLLSSSGTLVASTNMHKNQRKHLYWINNCYDLDHMVSFLLITLDSFAFCTIGQQDKRRCMTPSTYCWVSHLVNVTLYSLFCLRAEPCDYIKASDTQTKVAEQSSMTNLPIQYAYVHKSNTNTSSEITVVYFK